MWEVLGIPVVCHQSMNVWEVLGIPVVCHQSMNVGGIRYSCCLSPVHECGRY